MGLAGQQALADMAARQGQLAQTGGQLGLQYGQLSQQDIAQASQLAQQRAGMAQGIGALAGQTGDIAGRLGALGQVQAGFGQQAQGQRLQDINALMAMGGMQQQQAQNILEAQYQADQAAYNQPLQQIGFLADLTKALPSSQSALFQQSAPSPSVGQQVAGLGIGAMGLAKAASAF